MTVEELLARCDLVRASEKKLAECKPFSCGEGDIDEFFANDCLVNQRKLLGKTYLFCLKRQPLPFHCPIFLTILKSLPCSLLFLI